MTYCIAVRYAVFAMASRLSVCLSVCHCLSGLLVSSKARVVRLGSSLSAAHNIVNV